MPRLRDLGLAPGTLPPGESNAITDVPGIRVGQTTLVRGDSVRTGVTVILPRAEDPWVEPVFAGAHRLNGNGELTGLEWIRESGLLSTPVALTNTHSVGVVRDALVAWEASRREGSFWSLPVVGETWDGVLNDVNGMHVARDDVLAALAAAASGSVPEGNSGGGTGMICHGFKGGTGTASRVVPASAGSWTVGVLVQANHGRRERLTVLGRPVGAAIPPEEVPTPGALDREGAGSIIVVVATDAPLLPNQCARLAQRAGLGVARVGGVGENFSGDLFLCFATGNRGLPVNAVSAGHPLTVELRMLGNHVLDALFDAVVEATEEAILNALLAAETMTGRDGVTAYALDEDRLLRALD